MGELDGYVDILEPRRCGSDAKWAARRWAPTTANTLPHNSSAAAVQVSVLSSTKLRHVIYQISADENVSPEELYKRVKDILYEMGYCREMAVVRLLGIATSKLLKRLCSSIYIKQDALLKVKNTMAKNPVLFVPTHRSYADFILMSYICFHFDINIPCVAAGMDFHGMALIGEVLRNTGAFFMRRTFNNDKLYSATFAEYVQTLIIEGDAAVEFFIEGTRSRTAKSLMPKFGLLSMALKPFLTGQVPDISIVPITISYDRCLEENLFAYELLGVPKPKESTRGFFKAMRILSERYGDVFANFGDPISVKELLDARVDRSVHSYGPVILQDCTPEECRQIQFLAHEVVDRQRWLTVLMGFNFIAAVFINHVLKTDTSCSLEFLTTEVKWLSTILRAMGASDSLNYENVNDEVLHSLELHKNLLILNGDVIELNNSIRHSKLNSDVRLRGHELQPKTMDSSVPFTMLQHYVNPMLFHLVSCSAHILALSIAPQHRLNKSTMLSEYFFFRNIFSHEFVFNDVNKEQDFKSSIDHCLALSAISVEGDEMRLGANEKFNSFIVNILSSFIPSYVALLQTLLTVTSAGYESDILKNAQALVETKLLCGEITHPANLSLDGLSNGLQSLVGLGVVSKIKRNGTFQYSINTSSLQIIMDKLVRWNELLHKRSLIENDLTISKL